MSSLDDPEPWCHEWHHGDNESEKENCRMLPLVWSSTYTAKRSAVTLTDTIPAMATSTNSEMRAPDQREAAIKKNSGSITPARVSV